MAMQDEHDHQVADVENAHLRELLERAQTDGKLSIPDVYRLLDELGKRNHHRGLSYAEIESMRRLTPEFWAKARGDYHWTLKTSFVANPVLLLILWLAGAAMMGMFDGALRWIGGLLLLLFAYLAGGRSGHRTGYDEGYVMGHDNGINRALVLSDDQAAAIARANREHETDQHIARHFDAKDESRREVT